MQNKFVAVWNDEKTEQKKAFVLLRHDGRLYVEHPVYGDEETVHVVNGDNTISCTGCYEISDILDDIRYNRY